MSNYQGLTLMTQAMPLGRPLFSIGVRSIPGFEYSKIKGLASTGVGFVLDMIEI